MTNEQLIELGKDWFVRKKWQAFPFQIECWESYLNGHSGLLNAPTGSGKTYALWMPCLLEHIRNQTLPKDRNNLQYIWITPLRALAKDIQLAMQAVANDMNTSISIAIRNGDTDQNERQKQKRNAPHCLVTTPESLHLLLSNKDAANFFSNLKAVIVDEWHELLSTKRGVQIELALSRLKSINSNLLKIWGISATIGNLEEAKNILLGFPTPASAKVVKANIPKQIEINSVLPTEVEKYPWGGHLGINLLDQVLPIIYNNNTTLLFTNTRSQTEIWYHQILTAAPDLAGIMAMHHGSIDAEVRTWVEEALHQGKLKLVVCTSSLDLGVDFRPVDTVIQVGGPKGVARFLQRAGRSGHAPGEKSVIYFVPTHSLELVEAAALRSALDDNQFESRTPLKNCTDVLIQYLVTLATGDGFKEKTILKEVQTTYCYQSISHQEWQWILQFITNGGEALGQYEEYSKVVNIEGVYKIATRRAAMRHRMSIGTIVGDAVLRVKFISGGTLGTVEESFVAKLNPGEVFWFAGRSLEFVMIKEMVVLVRKAKKNKGKIPTWQGGRMPLSSQLAYLIKSKLENAALGQIDDVELKTIKPILDLQSRWSLIPGASALLIEKVKSRSGHHIFVYPFAGRFVHEVLAGLIAYRIGQLQPLTFSIAINDYGFELLADENIPIEDALEQDLFSMDGIESDLQFAINHTELAKRRFRDIATIAGLLIQNMPGQKQISNKHLQASSGILFKVFQEYDEENLLLKQSNEEVLNLYIDFERLKKTMATINYQKIVLKYPPQPTPFSFPIMVDGLRQKLSTEKISDRILKMQLELEKYAMEN